MIDLNRFRKMIGTADGATPAEPAPAPGRRQLSRYEILREVGRGGMGVVYEAFDPELKRRVAIKVLKDTEGHPAALARLQREALAAARLRHPNIVPVYEVGTVLESSGAAVHFIVMAYIDGRTLDEALPALSRRERLHVLEVVARAVGHANRQGVIHRDLKPQNVMVEPPRDGDPSDFGRRVYILDFGLAKLNEGENLTQSGAVLGTPNYMAPEQVLGEHRRISPATDVWGLGVMLYQLLTGRMPFDGQTALDIYTRITGHDPARPRSLDRTLPQDLEAICLKALNKHPLRRYPGAHEFAEELRRHLAGEPVHAKPPSATGVLLNKLVKRKGVLVTAALGLLATAFLAAFTIPRWIRAERERSRAEAEGRRKEGEMAALSKMQAEETMREAAEQQRRKDRIVAMLGDLKAGLARPGRPPGAPLVDDYVFECSQYSDEQTVTLLAEALAPLAAKASSEIVWTQEERVLMTFAFRVLGRIDRDSAVAPLAGMMAVLRDSELAVACGQALCHTRRAAAEAPLMAARDRLGANSGIWIQISQLLSKLPLRPGRAEPASAAEFHARGRDREARGDLDGACSDFTRALEIDPDLAAAHTDRGSVRRARADLLAENGRLTEAAAERESAIADFTRAIELNPSDAAPYTGRGIVYRDVKDFARAVADHSRSLEIDPRSPNALNNRAAARYELGDLKGAVADYTGALDLDPTLAHVWANRGATYHAMGLQKRAIEDCTQAIKLNPQYAVAYTHRGFARHVTGDLDGAIADYSRTIDLDPRNPAAFNSRGNARSAKGDLDGAIADYSRAIDLNSAYVAAYQHRAGVLVKKGEQLGEGGRLDEASVEWGRAIGDYTRALELGSREPTVLVLRGVALQYRGDVREAVEDWTRFLELWPEDRNAPAVRRFLEGARAAGER